MKFEKQCPGNVINQRKKNPNGKGEGRNEFVGSQIGFDKRLEAEGKRQKINNDGIR